VRDWHGQDGEFMDYKFLGLFFAITSDHIVYGISGTQARIVEWNSCASLATDTLKLSRYDGDQRVTRTN